MESLNKTEELEAFKIVKNILGKKVKSERITPSNAKTYFAIVLDNNNRRTICRLYLGPKKKYIGTISNRKVETRTQIASIHDILKFSDDLMFTVYNYDNH
ncbi:MAG TPA: hypothetical protein VK623_05710 [Flavobacterium sp.]|nr:hypothetical protein [Flavobacterium sp.]